MANNVTIRDAGSRPAAIATTQQPDGSQRLEVGSPEQRDIRALLETIVQQNEDILIELRRIA